MALSASAAHGQFQRNEYELQREHAQKFEPAPLLAPGPQGRRSSITPVRIRFYADGDYRSGGRWQERMKAQLLDMNQIVEQAFGIQFQAESFRRWERGSGSGSLDPMLEELERLDPGTEVDWVVGLASPLPLVSMSFHDLGRARVLGRHFVLRGMSSVDEMRDFERIFKALHPSDREKLYGRRKSHKEIAVFLHEWAHTLGALHVDDATRIMSPGYSTRTSLFSVPDAELIAFALDARLRSRGRQQVDWTSLRQYLRDSNNPEWRDSDKQALLAHLGSGPAPTTGSAPAGLPDPVPPPPGLKARPRPSTAAPAPPEPDLAQLGNAIRDQLNTNKLKQAGAGLSEGLRRFPQSAELVVMDCELLLRKQRHREATRRCNQALALKPDLARGHYLLGCIQAETGQVDKAIVSLKRAIELEPRDRNAWDSLAELYRALGRSREFSQFAAENGGAAAAAGASPPRAKK